MSTHSKLSPSSRHRWSKCPGSVREEAKYPPQASGAAAVDGTHSHTLLAHCLENYIEPASMVGKTLSDHDGEFAVDAARAARVKIAVDYVNKAAAACHGEVLVEKRVGEELCGRDDLSGTADVQIISDKLIEVIDYKDGMVPVPVERNPQLTQYAMGVISDVWWPLIQSDKLVRITVIQPKLADKRMPIITSWDTTIGEMVNEMQVLGNEALATDDPDAPLVPGVDQCKYCRAKGNCAALNGHIMKESGIVFHPIVKLDVAQQIADKDPTTMSDAQLVQIMEVEPLMVDLISNVKKELQRRLEAGEKVAGVKLVSGRGSRAWVYPEDEMAPKLVKMGIPKSALFRTEMLSLAKIEQIKWEKKGELVGLSAKQLDRLSKEYVTRVEGKPVLALESDRRPAVVTDVSHMFSAIAVETPVAESLPDWLK